MQRPQNPCPRWPHRVENSIRLGIAGVGLNGIPAVNNPPVLYEEGIRARMPLILETNTSHPANQRLNGFRMDRVLGYFRMDCVLKYQYSFRFRLPFPSPFQWGQAMTGADCVLNWCCQFLRR